MEKSSKHGESGSFEHLLFFLFHEFIITNISTYGNHSYFIHTLDICTTLVGRRGGGVISCRMHLTDKSDWSVLQEYRSLSLSLPSPPPLSLSLSLCPVKTKQNKKTKNKRRMDGCQRSSYLSYLSRSLADRWGTTVDFTTSFLHSSRFSAFRSVMFHGRPVHSLMLFSHRFLCLPLRLPP